MSILHKLLVAFGVVIALAAGVTAFGIGAISGASGLVVRLYDEPFMAVSHSRAAQAKFNEARSAMELILAGSEASRATISLLESAVKETLDELEVVGGRMKQSETDIKNAQALVQDWYRTGMKIIDSNADGIVELPLSATVVRKAAAVVDAIDQIVEAASAFGFQFRSEAE